MSIDFWKPNTTGIWQLQYHKPWSGLIVYTIFSESNIKRIWHLQKIEGNVPNKVPDDAV